MSRAEILFTAGYVFQGDLNTENLREAFHAIVDNIGKFGHQIDFTAQNDFHWRPFAAYEDRFHVLETDDLEEEFIELSARGFELRSSSKNFPMNLVVIKSTHPETENRFILAQMCSHEYIDARSAETILHLIVDYYNAMEVNNYETMRELVSQASNLHTLHAEEMIQRLRTPDYDLEANVQHLASYPIADVGGHGVRLATLPELLPKFAERKRRPVTVVVDAKRMIEHCRTAFPEVTKNAVITGVLHKALYNINTEHLGKNEPHIISGKTVSDLLPADFRRRYIGNYIAFVPVSTPGEIPVEHISKGVHDRIVEFKSRQINLTCFELVEQGAAENAVGTADDELSYIITNWNNYRFLAGKSFLAGCESLAHLSAVNVDPLDAGGAALINRAVVVINLSFDDQLCFSMFPSLREDSENERLVAEVERLFLQA